MGACPCLRIWGGQFSNKWRFQWANSPKHGGFHGKRNVSSINGGFPFAMFAYQILPEGCFASNTSPTVCSLSWYFIIILAYTGCLKQMQHRYLYSPSNFQKSASCLVLFWLEAQFETNPYMCICVYIYICHLLNSTTLLYVWIHLHWCMYGNAKEYMVINGDGCVLYGNGPWHGNGHGIEMVIAI